MYSEKKENNGTHYLVVTQRKGDWCIGQVFYDTADDMPLIEKAYPSKNLVTTATAVWLEYKQIVQKAIAQRLFEKEN